MTLDDLNAEIERARAALLELEKKRHLLIQESSAPAQERSAVVRSLLPGTSRAAEGLPTSGKGINTARGISREIPTEQATPDTTVFHLQGRGYGKIASLPTKGPLRVILGR